MGGANDATGTPTKSGQSVTNPPPKGRGGDDGTPPSNPPKSSQKIDAGGPARDA